MAEKLLKWQIYVLRCPKTYEVRYVGQTRHLLTNRLKDHLCGNDLKTRKYQWIKSLKKEKLSPSIHPIEGEIETQDLADAAERKWIAQYRLNGCRLVNGTDGGSGCSGWSDFETRSTLAKRRWIKKTPEERSATAKKRWLIWTPEQQAENIRKRFSSPATQVKRIATLKSRTPEQIAEVTAKRLSKIPFERWSAIAKKREANKTPEERKRIATIASHTIPKELRSALCKERALRKTPEERSAIAMKREANMTPEQHAARAKAHSVQMLKKWAEKKRLAAEQALAHVPVATTTSGDHDLVAVPQVQPDERGPASAASAPSHLPAA